MSFETIVRTYLSKLSDAITEARATGQFTDELSYRPVLDEFFVELSSFINPQIKRVFEPKSQSGMGRPDWRFYNSDTLGVYGYIDSKGLDFDNSLPVDNYLEQINRYLTLGHQVILTDGIEFIFFSSEDGSFERTNLISKPLNSDDLRNPQPDPRIDNKFREFFEMEDARRISEEQLVGDVALRARLLSESILELVDLPNEAGIDEVESLTIKSLNDLKTIIENHHDPTLRDPIFFADFVSQVLIFGLLYAHRILISDDDRPIDRYNKILGFWNQAPGNYFAEDLLPFRAIFRLLNDELESLSVLGTWYKDCALLLAYVELGEEQQIVPDYHNLFESFLEAYDPKIRFNFGAFYTPKKLAGFMVRLVNEIIQKEYPELRFYDPENKFIDPGCGTGTFIEQLFIQRPNDETLPKLIGFEILPAPYALAHYRMAMIASGFVDKEKIQIILTNTLSDELEEIDNEMEDPNLMQHELARANNYSTPPLTLIIGNPPSSDISLRSEGQNFIIIEDLLEDFRPPDMNRRARQNTQKQIKNEFMKFLRWSTNKLLQSKPGVLAFVLPSSFNEHPSYLFARKWLYENFSKIWIIDLDSDARSGIRTSSIFNTLQGRTLLIAFTGFPEVEDSLRTYQYFSISSFSREEKIEWLSQESLTQNYQEFFTEVDLTTESYAFRPSPEFDAELYSHFWPLYPQGLIVEEGEAFIFERHCSGIKLAPSSLFVHVNKGVLFRKLRDIGNHSNSVDLLLERWFVGQQRPPSRNKFTEAVRQEIANQVQRNDQNGIAWYSYRPMLNLHGFISEPVLRILTRTGGGGTRYRPELLSAFQKDEVKGIALSPAPKDIGETLHRFVSFCWDLPDNDLAKRGNARILSDYYPEYKSGNEWDPTPRANLNTALIEMLTEHYQSEVTNDNIVYYTYAVLCSDSYLDGFEGALFTVADSAQRPRIPMTAEKEIFFMISEIGEQLAALEKNDEELNTDLLQNRFERFADYFQENFNLTNFKVNLERESIDLLQDNMLQIEILPVPREVLEFKISGYLVVQQWLKVHTIKYSRMHFDQQQFGNLILLLEKIQAQIELIKQLDKLVGHIVSGNVPLISAQ